MPKKGCQTFFKLNKLSRLKSLVMKRMSSNANPCLIISNRIRRNKTNLTDSIKRRIPFYNNRLSPTTLNITRISKGPTTTLDKIKTKDLILKVTLTWKPIRTLSRDMCSKNKIITRVIMKDFDKIKN